MTDWEGHPVQQDDSLPEGTLAISSGTQTVIALIKAGLPPAPLFGQPVVMSFPTRAEAEAMFERALATVRSGAPHWIGRVTGCEVWPDGAPCGQPGVETLRFCTGERDEHGGIDPLVVCADHLAEYLADQLLAGR